MRTKSSIFGIIQNSSLESRNVALYDFKARLAHGLDDIYWSQENVDDVVYKTSKGKEKSSVQRVRSEYFIIQ